MNPAVSGGSKGAALLARVTRLLGFLVLGMIVATVAVVVMYGLFHHLVKRSESFQFVAAEIKNSAEVRAKIGEVSRIEPAPFGPYNYQSSNQYESLQIRLAVTGSMGEAQVDAAANAANGLWSLTQLTILPAPDSNPVSPNPSIERTSQRPLRALWSTAHVER